MSGQVVNENNAPVEQATVSILTTSWSTLTGADGRFALALDTGRWEIKVTRIGYHPRTLVIASAADSSLPLLRVTLTAAPFELRTVAVRDEPLPAMTRSALQEMLEQVPPAVEPDVFRALVMLPSVSQPDDLKGRVHLAGGASDETGVYLDGHPLQHPFHLLSLLGAFNIAALERADLLIHHLPASYDGRLSGVIDLQTLRAPSLGGTETSLSLLSASGTHFSPKLPLGFDLLASARATFIDYVAERTKRSSDDDYLVPNFRDGLMRLGRSWNNSRRVELLGFANRDEVEVLDSPFEQATPFSWGESLLGVRVEHRGFVWDVQSRIAINRASANWQSSRTAAGQVVDNTRDWLSGAVAGVRRSRRWQLKGEVSLDLKKLDQRWKGLRQRRRLGSERIPPDFAGVSRNSYLGVSFDAERQLGYRWSLNGGLRLTRSSGQLYAAPRLALSHRPVPELSIEAAFNRRHQFDAELEEPAVGSLMPPLFLLDRPRIADVVATVMTWEPPALGRSISVSSEVQAFIKFYHERTIARELLGEAPFPTADPHFPDFGRVDGRSDGVALAGRVAWKQSAMVQGKIEYQRARELLPEGWSPTSFSAPMTANVLATLSSGDKWTLTSAFQMHSGAAITPAAARILTGIPDDRHLLTARYVLGPRNSLRLAAYRRLDVGIRRAWRLRVVDLSVSAQVLNVTARQNVTAYDWAAYFSGLEGPLPMRGIGVSKRSLPILPSIGVQVRW